MDSGMKIKVCGMREAENMKAVESLGAGMIGMIFWKGSSRYVSEKPKSLPTRCKRVGVFVDEDVERVVQTVGNYALDYVQLHGSESPSYILTLRRQLEAAGFRLLIIKAFNIATAADLAATVDYAGVADVFLFDTKGRQVGGNGEKFNWQVLSHYGGTTPFLLSGGIGPDDAGRVRAFSHPQCMGIDLNSRFETCPGMKDIAALSRFIDELNK